MSYQIKVSDKVNEEFTSRVYDRRILMRQIAARGHSLILKRLVSGIKPANSSLTQAIKKGSQTLRDNGRLVASMTYRSDADSAVVGSNHIAAALNNPPDDSTEYEVVPKKAKWLTVPAGWQTRTLMRRYGWTPREVIEGLRNDGYSVFRPYKKGSHTVRSNVIMASLKGSRKLKSGKTSKAKSFDAFVVFLLLKKVTVPVRRFLYLDEGELQIIDRVVEEFYS